MGTYTDALTNGGKQINLSGKEFSTFPEFYELVAGRCNNATLFLSHEQAVVVYHLFASETEWREPNVLPADYRVSAIKSIQVIED